MSLGCGVNSTALLILKSQGKLQFDHAIFADTGGENPETYQYLHDVITPFCKEYNIELHIIKSNLPPLREYYIEKKIIPTRRFRHCTSKYKIRPLTKFCATQFPSEKIEFIVGIANDEAHRAKIGYGNIYPLVDMGIDREGCKQLILDAGLPLPIKSGCYFCPFTPKNGWINLLENHHDLFLKAEELEKSGKRYPRMTLTNKTLESVRKSKEDQTSLCDYTGSCVFCEVSS